SSAPARAPGATRRSGSQARGRQRPWASPHCRHRSQATDPGMVISSRGYTLAPFVADMTDLFTPAHDAPIALADYAERAYLEYALSVVKGRALPDVCDGQKPVQRRILYSMQRMGLSWSGASGAKPVKSARVVGDVL